MLSSAKKSVATTKQFIEPYYIEIAPGGAIVATCPRFSTFLFNKNIYSFLGKNVLDVFALLGYAGPSLSPFLFDRDDLPIIDLPVHRSGVCAFVIRWMPTPLRGLEGETEGWQLTGMRMDPDPDHLEVKEMCAVTEEGPGTAGLIRYVSDIVVTTDPEGRVLHWNLAAEKLYDISAREAMGRSFPDLVRHGYMDCTEEEAMQTLHKQGIWEGERSYASREGKKSYLISSIRFVRDSGRRITGIMTLSRDITENKLQQQDRKKAEMHLRQQEALLAMEKKLLEQELSKQKLVAQAMMDAQEKERAEIGKELQDNINQILSTTKLYLELAKNDTAERLNLINRSAGNIHTAIHEIRNISRSLVPASIGDVGLIDSLTDLVESVSSTRAIHVEFYPAGNFESTIDEKIKLMLFRIIQEQINNVLKHSGARNLIIELVLEETENVIELNITDDGNGFDPARARKGLGLSNITSRADLFGGKVTIVSAPGRGCQLKVRVPL